MRGTAFPVILAVASLAVVQFAIAGEWITHGFVSQGYLKSDENNFLVSSREGSAQFNEIGLNAMRQLGDRWRFGAQVLSTDLGEKGNNKPLLDWAFWDYRYNERWGLRAGKVKVPWGFYNQERDVDLLRTTVLLPGGVYSEEMRDILTAYHGVHIYGSLVTKKGDNFEYDWGYGGRPLPEDTVLLKKYEWEVETQGVPFEWNEPEVKAMSGRIIWKTREPGLRFAYSRVVGEATFKPSLGPLVMNLPAGPGGAVVPVMVIPPLNRVDMNTTVNWKVYSIGYEKKDWKYDLEIMDMPILSHSQAIESTALGAFKEEIPYSYYFQVTKRINQKFEVAALYSVYFAQKHDRDGTQFLAEPLGRLGMPAHSRWQKDKGLSFRYDIRHDWLVKLEFHRLDGTAQCYGYNSNPIGSTVRDWNLLAMKTTYMF